MTNRRTAPPVRPALSRDRIIEAALGLVADEGLAGFSIRKLGQRLGVEAMSIYHHFPSKQHVLDALVTHAIEAVEIPEPGPQPAERLRQALNSYRAMARRYPALFPLVAVHRLNMPAGVHFIERILALIRGVQPDTEMASRYFRAMGYYLIGAGLEETAGYARGPSAAEPVSDEFIVNNCPNLVACAPWFREEEWDATFELGISVLMQGAQQPAAAKPLTRRRKSGSTAGR